MAGKGTVGPLECQKVSRSTGFGSCSFMFCLARNGATHEWSWGDQGVLLA